MTLSSENQVQAIIGQLGGNLNPDAGTAVPKTVFPQDIAWQARVIDPTIGERIAYDGCTGGYGCCYAAFYSIIGQMADQYGAPYKDFPFHAMKAGRSGVGGWGTACGALLGAAFAFGLFYEKKEHNELVRELFYWHNTTPLPIFRPAANCKLDVDLPKSVIGTVLCSTSKAKWAYESGFKIKSKECSERCARLTADVARKAIEILNAKIAGTFVSTVTGKDACLSESSHEDTSVSEGAAVQKEQSSGSVILVRQPEFKSVKRS